MSFGNRAPDNNAERCRRYRRKQLIENPDYVENECRRQQQRRKSRTPEQIQRDRDTAKERMKRLRQRRVEEQKAGVISGSSDSGAAKLVIKTRQQTETQRQKWRNSKKKYRNGLSAQKKRRIREKDRERKELKASKNQNVVTTAGTSESGYNTPAAARKAVYRAKIKLPCEPKKYALVVKGLVMSATPKKRKALEAEIPLQTPKKKRRIEFCEKTIQCFQQTFQKVKKSRMSKDTKAKKIMATQIAKMRKYRMLKYCSNEIGIRYNSLRKWSQLEPTDDGEFPRQKRSDALADEVVKQVKDFYLKPAVSVTHSTKKTVLKKSMKQKQTMNFTLKAAHQNYKVENQSNISFSQFASLKPKHVETVGKNTYRGCLCEQCTNVELHLKALNKKLDKDLKIKDKYMINQLTLCESEKENHNHPKLQCVKRECDQCGVKLLRQRFQNIGTSDEEVKWFQWELLKVKNPKYDSQQSRKKLVEHIGTFNELLQSLMEKLEPFAHHLFVAMWQHKQFQNAKKGLEQGQVLCVLDFAENMTLRNQDECQSAHWGAHQVTVHPIVCYYLKCDENAEKKDEKKADENAGKKDESIQLMTHEIVYISDDLTHDAHMVQKCVSQTLEILNGMNNTVKHMIQFTDGCSSQYKSKTPFADLSMCETDHKIKIERHFFGTSHGKGPADGCSGVVKSAVSRAMKASTVINTGAEMYDFCKERLEKSSGTFRRTFVYLAPEEVNRCRPERSAAKPIKGTRQLHAVKAIQPGILAVRNLSCCCNFCLNGNGECPSSAIVGEWKTETVLKVHLPRKQSSTEKERRPHENPPQSDHDSVEEMREDDIPAPEMNVDDLTEHTNECAKEEMEPNRNLAVSREQYFAGKLKELNMSESYEILHEKSLALKQEFESMYSIQLQNNISIVDSNLSADKVAFGLLPDGFKKQHPTQLPVNVVGDGNCLPRCGSILAFGHEMAHEEIRARIVVEMVCNQSYYTDNAFLNKGIELPNNEKNNLCKTYTMFSDIYMNEAVTRKTIKRIFQQEAMNITNLCSYMGIWQLFALSTVLKCNVRSVYPSHGAALPRLLLNRVILPTSTDATEEVNIMWTSTRQDMSEKHWIPNHFVPILSMGPATETDDFDLSDDDSFSLLDFVEIDDVISSTLFDTSEDQNNNKAKTSKFVDPDVRHSFDEDVAIIETVKSSNEKRSDGVDDEMTVFDQYEVIAEWSSNIRYQSGDFILVCHGSSLLPAVVTDWPMVNFFARKKKDLWILSELQHSLIPEDVLEKLKVPEIKMVGSRLYYKFELPATTAELS